MQLAARRLKVESTYSDSIDKMQLSILDLVRKYRQDVLHDEIRHSSLKLGTTKSDEVKILKFEI